MRALRRESGCDERVVGLVQRAPIAAVDEHHHGRFVFHCVARENIQGLIQATAIVHVLKTTLRGPHLGR